MDFDQLFYINSKKKYDFDLVFFYLDYIADTNFLLQKLDQLYNKFGSVVQQICNLMKNESTKKNVIP